ncbi:hypothetical protein [Sinomicrobium sp. M5D2P9]
MLNYVFYAIYKFILITPSKDELPGHLSSSILAFILSFNLILIKNILLKYDIHFLADLYESNTIYLGVFIALVIVCFLAFAYKGKYLKIVAKYDQESRNQKIIKMSLVALYVIGSFVLLAII